MLAVDFLFVVVVAGDRIPRMLWSVHPACPSPSHLACLSVLELGTANATRDRLTQAAVHGISGSRWEQATSVVCSG
ncbi:hypothetical protein E2562_015559 [Oryza meyeriana var. granulata]|uniref:Uncharacterized protein n=1 Tax=Oryza meyeriana var. granulata TaxID=110450 RepID=A0A6G1CHE6_9ORYZ|nr:hypothetical protein E2562_015559 [Oryza meyeriana var. granulata]